MEMLITKYVDLKYMIDNELVNEDAFCEHYGDVIAGEWEILNSHIHYTLNFLDCHWSSHDQMWLNVSGLYNLFQMSDKIWYFTKVLDTRWLVSFRCNIVCGTCVDYYIVDLQRVVSG